jgi:hypothetical protein
MFHPDPAAPGLPAPVAMGQGAKNLVAQTTPVEFGNSYGWEDPGGGGFLYPGGVFAGGSSGSGSSGNGTPGGGSTSGNDPRSGGGSTVSGGSGSGSTDSSSLGSGQHLHGSPHSIGLVATPEPSSWPLIVIALAGWAVYAKRAKSSRTAGSNRVP